MHKISIDPGFAPCKSPIADSNAGPSAVFPVSSNFSNILSKLSADLLTGVAISLLALFSENSLISFSKLRVKAYVKFIKSVACNKSRILHSVADQNDIVIKCNYSHFAVRIVFFHFCDLAFNCS